MRLEWLEDILAVAETGSLAEASERRLLTQSAFSRRIQQIEDAVGAELFDRSRRPVQLRQTTKDQLDQIARATVLLRQIKNDLRLGDRRSRKRIVIASQHALTTSLAPEIIKAIKAREDDIFVRLRSANLDECFSLLLARQADLAVVYKVAGEEHPIEADYLETLVIGSDQLIPVGDALLQRMIEEPGPHEVPVIAYPSDVFLGEVIERQIYPRLPDRLKVTPQAETALTLAALEMAAVGLGLAWVPQSLAADYLATGRLVDLSTHLSGCTIDVAAVRLAKGLSPAEIAAWEVLVEWNRELMEAGTTTLAVWVD